MVEAAGREVVVYTQPGCPCCAREKRFLETKVAAGNPPSRVPPGSSTGDAPRQRFGERTDGETARGEPAPRDAAAAYPQPQEEPSSGAPGRGLAPAPVAPGARKRRT